MSPPGGGAGTPGTPWGPGVNGGRARAPGAAAAALEAGGQGDGDGVASRQHPTLHHRAQRSDHSERRTANAATVERGKRSGCGDS